MDLNDVEQINLRALGGQDRLVVNDLTGTDVTDVFVDLSGTADPSSGDAAIDTVTALATNGADTINVIGSADAVGVAGLAAGLTIVNADATDVLLVSGQGGDDNINASNLALDALTFHAFGGDGNDTITGSANGDQLFGDAGNDRLSGAGGRDLLFGGEGNDTLTGGDGDDQMFGQGGNDRMIWNPGDDSDVMEGGDGTDTAEVNGGNGGEVFTATANGDRVRFDRLDPAPFSIDIGTSENLVAQHERRQRFVLGHGQSRGADLRHRRRRCGRRLHPRQQRQRRAARRRRQRLHRRPAGRRHRLPRRGR